MSRTLRPLLHSLRRQALAQAQVRNVSSNIPYFAPGDRVLLRHTNNPEKVYLTQPLAAHKSAESHHGSIPHTDIIGRGPRDILATRRGTEFRLTWPTLDQYVTRVPRIVTPVYPLDAATIASLLDVHVDGGALAEGSAPLEIFEAGTGHGSLTLALARTVHAGNTHLAKPLSEEDKARRGAVVHSLDISAKHSAHARDVVKGFRRGMYMDDIEFYVGDPSVWIRQQMKERGLEARDGEGEAEGFLYAVLLDLPGHDDHLAAAAEATLTDGIVGVFCPSITQVAACLKMVKTQRLPLVLSQVLEFPGGAGTGAGLRSWDVRYARVRSRSDKKLSISEAENKDDAGAVGEGEEGRESEYEMVCRPTSFERVIGGGFFGIFRRKARGGEGPGHAKNLRVKPAVEVPDATVETPAAEGILTAAEEEETIAAPTATAEVPAAEGILTATEAEETIAEEKIEESQVENSGITGREL